MVSKRECMRVGLILVLTILSPAIAPALTLEQAREQCIAAPEHRAAVRSCIAQGGGRESCIDASRPAVRRCVQAKMGGGGGGGAGQVAGGSGMPQRGTPAFKSWCLRPMGEGTNAAIYHAKEAAGCWRS